MQKDEIQATPFSKDDGSIVVDICWLSVYLREKFILKERTLYFFIQAYFKDINTDIEHPFRSLRMFSQIVFNIKFVREDGRFKQTIENAGVLNLILPKHK